MIHDDQSVAIVNRRRQVRNSLLARGTVDKAEAFASPNVEYNVESLSMANLPRT